MSDLLVVLLRAVNVWGNLCLPMKELVEIVASAGGSDVRTYIQSGNVVCVAPDAAALGAGVAAGIEARFGFAAPVVVRTRTEWEGVLRANPFPAPGVPSEQVYVAFLAEVPAPERAARLDPERSPGDRFALVGRDVYLHLATGGAETRLTNVWLDRTLATVSTARNWRTVLALAELAGCRAPGM